MKRKSNKNSLIYIRCRFCGQVFKGNSDGTIENWFKHLSSCEKKQKNKKRGREHRTLCYP